MFWRRPGFRYVQAMSTADDTRSAAAIELADAILAEFNDPSSALKGIGKVTMEKLLTYSKISEKAMRKRIVKRAEDDAAP